MTDFRAHLKQRRLAAHAERGQIQREVKDVVRCIASKSPKKFERILEVLENVQRQDYFVSGVSGLEKIPEPELDSACRMLSPEALRIRSDIETCQFRCGI